MRCRGAARSPKPAGRSGWDYLGAGCRHDWRAAGARHCERRGNRRPHYEQRSGELRDQTRSCGNGHRPGQAARVCGADRADRGERGTDGAAGLLATEAAHWARARRPGRRVPGSAHGRRGARRSRGRLRRRGPRTAGYQRDQPDPAGARGLGQLPAPERHGCQ